jgi:hypothetical protein
MEKKLPDYYVENRSLKEYPTEVGAPKFSPDNISLFKQEKTFKLKKHFSNINFHYFAHILKHLSHPDLL